MKPEKISTGWWLITVFILFALLTRCAPAKQVVYPQFQQHKDSVYLSNLAALRGYNPER